MFTALPPNMLLHKGSFVNGVIQIWAFFTSLPLPYVTLHCPTPCVMNYNMVNRYHVLKGVRTYLPSSIG